MKKMVESREADVNILWHLRYRNLRFPHLSLLSRLDMVHCLPDIEKTKGRNTACSVGKKHR
jgi:hypothetical protein